MGALAGISLSAGRAFAAAPDPGLIAIMDTPDNAAKVVSKLISANVKTVARYYARKAQSSLPEKIMSSDGNMIGKEREPAILVASGLSIVSTYQYMNNLPEKFVSGLPDTGSAAKEAAADAEAALAQAKLVKQPEGSAIYFGVDFNLTKYLYEDGKLVRARNGGPTGNDQLIEAVLEYFRVLNRTVGNHFALGLYGNGFANRILRDAGLIKYSWISNSRSFEETSDFFNSGRWHLFQNQVDRRWFQATSTRSGLDVDTEVQNPATDGIGAWGNGEVDAGRNRTIVSQRRFATRQTFVLKNRDGSGGPIDRVKRVYDKQTKTWLTLPDNFVGRNANVRVISAAGPFFGVDMDDDGTIDGYVSAADLTADFGTMPPWDRPAPKPRVADT
jgi:hypothetical protein